MEVPYFSKAYLRGNSVKLVNIQGINYSNISVPMTWKSIRIFILRCHLKRLMRKSFDFL